VRNAALVSTMGRVEALHASPAPRTTNHRKTEPLVPLAEETSKAGARVQCARIAPIKLLLKEVDSVGQQAI